MKRTTTPILACLLLAPALAFAAAGAGEPAPAFKLKDATGKEISSASFDGKVRIYVFFATWSPESGKLLRELGAAETGLAADGIATVGLAVDVAGPEKVSAFAQDLGVEFPILLAEPRTSRDFAVKRMPTAVVIDKAGAVRKRYDGAAESSRLEADARELAKS